MTTKRWPHRWRRRMRTRLWEPRKNNFTSRRGNTRRRGRPSATRPQDANLPRIAASRKIAKFEKDIQGVMSGFDRVLFRGPLRRLTRSRGMKWYLAQNNVLCKQYEDHVKGTSALVKKGVRKGTQKVLGRSLSNVISSTFSGILAAEKRILLGS